MDLTMVPYGGGGGGGGGGSKEMVVLKPGSGEVKYKECMRNHAAGIGGHAFDGCGEFMAGGENGTIEALKCAACGCHRNFHRREGADLAVTQAQRFLLRAAVPVRCGGRTWSETPPTPPQQKQVEREKGVAVMRKRHRTKFTAEQKEKMQAFAERVGWKILRRDDEELLDFCREVGVKRHVLKVWMHNNKTHLAGGGGGAPKRHEAAAPPPQPISV